MIYIIHRLNDINKLKNTDKSFGVEVDIRINNEILYLNHEPTGYGDDFQDYLDNFEHKFLVANIKEAGIEDLVIDNLTKRGINFFLLDVEYPYIFKSINNSFRDISIRQSIYEPYENFLKLNKFFDWVWVDSFESNPLIDLDLNLFKKKRLTLVCPSRWDNAREIHNYKNFAKNNDLKFHSIMTSLEYIDLWDE